MKTPLNLIKGMNLKSKREDCEINPLTPNRRTNIHIKFICTMYYTIKNEKNL